MMHPTIVSALYGCKVYAPSKYGEIPGGGVNAGASGVVRCEFDRAIMIENRRLSRMIVGIVQVSIKGSRPWLQLKTLSIPCPCSNVSKYFCLEARMGRVDGKC